jgi:transposase
VKLLQNPSSQEGVETMATAEKIHIEQATLPQPTLFLAFELGQNTWKLGFTIGMAQQPRERTIPPGALDPLPQEIARAKQRFGLPEDARVVSCYEAGRDGFWRHRALVAHGVTNHVIDSASLEVHRRQRRAKTDRLDVRKLLTMLLRHRAGEKKVWSVVRVPSVEQEDRRQLHRAMLTANQDRTRVIKRIKGLLAGQGAQLALEGDVDAQLDQVHPWAGSPLPPALLSRLKRAWQQVGFLPAPRQTLEAQRRALLRRCEDPVLAQVRQLFTLRGIGVNSAWLYVMEFFAWRDFQPPKQVDARAGLTPTPYQSGQSRRELGIAKAGNRPIRAMAIEIAWAWRRFQPTRALSQWYEHRFGAGSARLRQLGIVALARKVLIALWRFLQTGVLPEGAVLKTAAPGR